MVLSDERRAYFCGGGMRISSARCSLARRRQVRNRLALRVQYRDYFQKPKAITNVLEEIRAGGWSVRDRHARPDGLSRMVGRRQAGSLPIFLGEISQMGGSRFRSAGPRDVRGGRWSTLGRLMVGVTAGGGRARLTDC